MTRSARPRRTGRPVAALVVALLAVLAAAVGLAGPAPAQVDPGASTTTPAGESTTTVTGPPDASTTAPPTTAAVDPAAPATTGGEAATTVPPPAGVPFPATLVGPVPPVEGDPDTAITDLYVTDGASPDEPDVVVQFREPFTFKGTPYRVGVVVGDPAGVRLRTWLISNGPGNLPYGRVERFEGGTWTALGATPVTFEDNLMILTVPIAEAPADGAVWAEIVENEAPTPSHTTPFFSRAALFGTAEAGTVPSATWGRVNGLDGVAADPLALPAGGVLVASGDRIAVTYAEPAPVELDGQPVTAVVDRVNLAEDFDGGAVVTDFVRLDRTTGEAGLYEGNDAVPSDRSGDRSWLVQAPPPGQPGSLILDRVAVATALGLPDGGSGLALGVSRELVLADGRIVTAQGVLATPDWLDLAPASAVPEPTTTTTAAVAAAPTAETSESKLWLLIGAGVALVVLLLLVVAWRRRGGADAEPAAVDEGRERLPWDAADGALISTDTHEFEALLPPDATPLPTPSPLVGAAADRAVPAAPVPEAPPAATPPAVPAAGAPAVAPGSPAGAPAAPLTGSGVRILGTVAAGTAAGVAAATGRAPEVEAGAEPADPAGPGVGGTEGSPLDAEPPWGTGPVPVVPAGAADQAPTEVGPPPADPGAPVAPGAALAALDQDLAELRRRVAGPG